MAKTTHVWFDLEGTLLKSAPYDAAVLDFAYGLYCEETNSEKTKKTRETFEGLLRQHKRKALLFVALGKSKKYYADAFVACFPFKKYIGSDNAVKHVVSFLKEKNVGLGVFTSLPLVPLTNILLLLGLDPNDFMLLSGDDVVKGKPDPEGFEKIVALCGVPPEQICFVGDSEFKDMAPAKNVGMQTVLVYASTRTAHADSVCHDFASLGDFFREKLLQDINKL